MILYYNSKLKSTYKCFRCLIIILNDIIKEYVADLRLNNIIILNATKVSLFPRNSEIIIIIWWLPQKLW